MGRVPQRGGRSGAGPRHGPRRAPCRMRRRCRSRARRARPACGCSRRPARPTRSESRAPRPAGRADRGRAARRPPNAAVRRSPGRRYREPRKAVVEHLELTLASHRARVERGLDREPVDERDQRGRLAPASIECPRDPGAARSPASSPRDRATGGTPRVRPWRAGGASPRVPGTRTRRAPPHAARGRSGGPPRAGRV